MRTSKIRARAISGLAVGDTFEVSRTFSREDSQRFAELSRDYNPVHFDGAFARAKRFDGLISHGLLVGSLLTEVGGQIGWLASGMSFDFLKPVYFGDTVTCRFVITELGERHRAEARAVFKNQHEQTVLTAVLRGIVPGPAEREILTRTIAEGAPPAPERGES